MSLRKLATDALAVALEYADAGTVEVGGNNRGDQVEWFQHTTGGAAGESWCADFVFACFLKAWCNGKGLLTGADAAANRAIMLAHADAMSKETGIPRTGYCPQVARSAKLQGRFKKAGDAPLPGDLVLYDFGKQGEPHHIGFVVEVMASGSLRTVEGNTSGPSGGSQSDGGGVYQKVRGSAFVFGFVSFR